ncbi:MAG: hypothetical protein CVU48_07730 [Candidatus Cloacimonetes bacterium HGW-Cloacimonetes-1]|jgi:type II secretory pathway pseudopilin PulG|nr:MAG: hypothetical protein CVU48_07730 [Candidatus Cloacimonetes bacterium HGW-Cloacimonetes-1]
MAEVKNNAEKSAPSMPESKAVKEDKTQNNASHNKISLIEIMMILMLVGLVFVFVFPYKQMMIDKEKEGIARQNFESVLPTFDIITKAAETYKKADEFGSYPAFIEEMNLGTIDTDMFKFEYADAGPTITAVTKEGFGKADIKVIYDITTKSYSVEDEKPSQMPTIKDDWLP